MAPWTVHADGRPQDKLTAGIDEVTLLQASAHRQLEPPAALSNETMLDASGCSVTDPRQAFHGCPESSLRRDADHSCGGDALLTGEKAVYFMRHATPHCCPDCGLMDEGVEQCKGLKEHNNLLLNLSKANTTLFVYSSPATRTMETALRIFGDTDAQFKIEPLLAETYPFVHDGRNGEKVINASKREELLEPYRALFRDGTWAKWHESPEDRVKAFTRAALFRPEKSIVVVSHFHFLANFPAQMAMGCMQMGESIILGTLTRGGKWRRVSDGSCEGRRRRWNYGNYRRLVTADSNDEE